tara:strand:- start:36 stop:236 length:201 start_codon:yes stop_codon:yes gene_type:complete
MFVCISIVNARVVPKFRISGENFKKTVNIRLTALQSGRISRAHRAVVFGQAALFALGGTAVSGAVL